MENKQKISKFLSLVLRHAPDKCNITLDRNGWTNVKTLLAELRNKGFTITMAELEDIVESNDKKRFAFNEGKSEIKANQGHSVEVDLALNPSVPPDFLYHGTVDKVLKNIMKTGLNRMDRHHVHLSESLETALKVSNRREGRTVIISVNSGFMHKKGFKFYQTDNGVWLTDHVPTMYIKTV